MLGINNAPVTIKSAEVAIIERAFAEGWIAAQRRRHRGPASASRLSARDRRGWRPADQLNRAGHLVTVFERADRIGGLLRYGIPEFKLEKRWLERRLALMREEGVTFRTGCHIGVNRDGRRAAARLRRHRLWPAGRRCRAICACRAASSRAFISRWNI